MKQPKINGRQARWFVYLTPYDFVIKHRPGTLNPADGPSRRPNYKAQEEPSLVQKDLLASKLVESNPDLLETARLNSGTCPLRQSICSGTCPLRQSICSGTSPSRQSICSGTCPSRQSICSGASPLRQPISGTCPLRPSICSGTCPLRQEISMAHRELSHLLYLLSSNDRCM